ncbi:hypothetical protein [Lederbergia lenta]|uniref:hypothetical protein n=1 Tax=Lederbergia lenta TaxID=1467 RepID=UPI00203AC48C|nr:hypothetical protein [Lederbergia lenta]MCM3110382.1 hypothetical protein [Lederbergia lenta]
MDVKDADFKELIALIGVTAAAFKAVTSGLKHLHDIRKDKSKQQTQKEKRRPRQKKRRK